MGLDQNRDNAPFTQVFSTKAHQFFVLVGVARIFCFLFLYEQFNCNSIKKYMHILDQDKCFAGLTYRYLRIQQHKIYYVPSSLYVTHK